MKRPSAFVFLLAPLAASLPVHAAGIPVAGRVLTPDGQGAPGVRVTLLRELPGFETSALELAGKAGPEPVSSVTARWVRPTTAMQLCPAASP